MFSKSVRLSVAFILLKGFKGIPERRLDKGSSLKSGASGCADSVFVLMLLNPFPRKRTMFPFADKDPNTT